METRNMLQFAVNLKMLYSGNEAISKASASMSKLQKATQNLQTIQNKVSGYQKTTENVSAMTTRLDELRSEYTTATSSASIYRMRVQDVGVNLKDARAKLSAMAKEMPKSSQAYKEQAARVKELEKQYRAAKASVKEFESEQKRLEAQISGTQSKLEREREALRNLEGELSRMGISSSNAAKKQEELAAAMERSQKAQGRYNEIRQNLSFDNVKNKVILPGIEAYASISPFVNISRDFEAAMARVKAVGFSGEGANLSQYIAMQEQARQLGADTQFTSVQAAQTMENLMRAGFSPEQVQASMRPVLDMAAAEGMDLAQAGSIVAGVISGFGRDANEAAKFADIMAWTSANSATSIANLGEAAKVAAPMASMIGVSESQLFSYLGALGNQQVQGGQAGNVLTNAWTRLADSETQKELAKYGVATITRDGKMRELADVMREFQVKTEKLGSVKQVDILKGIFGQNYGKYMLGFASEVQKGNQAKLETGAREKSSGAAQTMANINLDTLQGQITLLSSAWDGFKLKVGDTFSPIVRQGVEILNSSITTLTSIMEKFPLASKAAVLTMGAFASYRVVSGIFSIGKNILALPGAFVEVVAAGRNVQNVLQSVGGASGSVSLISRAFSSVKNVAVSSASVMGSVFTGIKSMAMGAWGIIAAHPFVAIGAAAAGAAVMIYRNWDVIREKFSVVSEYISEKWDAFTQGFSEKFSSVSNFVQGVWSSTGNFLRESFSSVREIFGSVSQSLSERFSVAANIIQGVWSSASNFLSEKFSSVIETCRNIFGSFANYFASWKFPNIFSGLGEMFSGALNSLRNIWSSFVDWLSGLNPFKNWGVAAQSEVMRAQSTAGKKSGSADYHIAAMNSAFAPPGFATGGIVNEHSIIQVAESGREAIIPLTNKSRGIPLLMQAARELGVVHDVKNYESNSQNFGVVKNLTGNIFSGVGGGQTLTENLSTLTRNSPVIGGVMASVSSVENLSTLANNVMSSSSLMGGVGGGQPLTENLSTLTRNSPVIGGVMASVSSVENLSTLANNVMSSSSLMGGVGGGQTLTENLSTLTRNLAGGVTSWVDELFSVTSNIMEARSDYKNVNANSDVLNRSNNGIFSRGDFSPVINITMTGGESQSAGEDIARKVREVLEEMMSYRERVAYA